MSRATGTITTVAGGAYGGPGDGGPATRAHLRGPTGVAVDASGNLAIADQLDARVRLVEARTGIITTAAGNGSAGYTGDNGPATAAGLGEPDAVAFNAAGDLFIADLYANRIRAVLACRTRLGAFDSSYPNDGSAAVAGGLALSWSMADSAFRYDVVVDTEFPPKKVLQQDVTGQGIQISGLEPGKTYYWQIRAKGIPIARQSRGQRGSGALRRRPRARLLLSPRPRFPRCLVRQPRSRSLRFPVPPRTTSISAPAPSRLSSRPVSLRPRTPPPGFNPARRIAAGSWPTPPAIPISSRAHRS